MAKIVLPRAGEKMRLPKVQEEHYLIGTEDGMLLRVSESELQRLSESRTQRSSSDLQRLKETVKRKLQEI